MAKEKNNKVKNKKNRFLTINLNNEFMKICEVTKTNKGVLVHRVISLPISERLFFDGFIRDRNGLAKELTVVLQKNGITTTNVIFTISSSKIATKEVIIPKVSDKKIASIVKMNATDYFPVNIDEHIIQSSVLEVIVDPDNKKDKKLRLMVAAVPNGMIEDYYDFASSSGLNIVAIDYIGNSTLQVLKQQSDDNTYVVVQVENDSTIVSVFENSILQLQRTIHIGKSMIVKAVMEKRKIYNYDVALDMLQKEMLLLDGFDDEITDAVKSLIYEVDRAINYYVRRSAENHVDKINLVGNATMINGFAEMFENNLTYNVVVWDSLKNVTVDKKLYVEENAVTSYIANIGAVIAPINFKPRSADIVEKEKKQATNQMGVVIVGALVGAAILIVFPYLEMNEAKSDMETAKTRLEGIRSIEQIMEEYRAAEAVYNDVNNFRIMTINHNDVIMEFINNLEKYLPSSVQLSNLSIDNGSVSFAGEASSKYDVAKLIMQLKSIENVVDVFNYSVNETHDENGNVLVEFNLTCSFYNIDVISNVAVEGE